MRNPLLLLLLPGWPGLAQVTVCQPTPTYAPCEIVFDLTPKQAEAHANPYLTVQLDAEFRSPRFRTFRMPAFWDGGRKFVIRFAPTDPGDWVFRVVSNIADLNGQEGRFSATASQSPGFLQPANVHHWAFVDDTNKTPHLWMGDTLLPLPFVDRAAFQAIADTRAAQKFTHLRGIVLAKPGAALSTYASADQPNPAVFDELDWRIRYLNGKGIVADLVLAWSLDQLTRLFPSRQQQERYLRYLVARYAGMNITWQGVPEFENHEDGRALMKEIGQALKRLDPYQHPRTTGSAATSAPLAGDEWMDFIAYGSADNQLGAIEHQLYGVPLVNLDLGAEDSGAGKAGPHDVDTDSFRRRLWNAAMDGQYPTYANTGTAGTGSGPVDPKYADSAGAKQMAAWFNFFSGTRHWELEPYFDVDGGRAVALEGVEYIVYVEKPGPVEVLVEKHGYDVAWFNPVTGEFLKVKKGYKGDHFTGEPPDKSHDWVLSISREGRKESMARSYKFESRAIGLQEIETIPQKAPFEMAEPAGDTLSLSRPSKYAIKITRETRATRTMMFLWTGEVAAEQRGFRVLGTGPEGELRIPAGIASSYPVDMVLRLFGMNANGKVYQLLRAVKLTK